MIILSLGLEVDGRPDIVIDLTKPGSLEDLNKHPFTIKEGATFRMKARFRVQHGILSGLKYVQVVSRMGVKSKMQEMIVSSSPLSPFFPPLSFGFDAFAIWGGFPFRSCVEGGRVPLFFFFLFFFFIFIFIFSILDLEVLTLSLSTRDHTRLTRRISLSTRRSVSSFPPPPLAGFIPSIPLALCLLGSNTQRRKHHATTRERERKREIKVRQADPFSFFLKQSSPKPRPQAC